MIQPPRSTAIVAVLLIAAACSRSPTDEAAGVATAPSATSAAGARADVRTSDAASSIALDPLSARDLAGSALSGELGCSFMVGRDPLLVAMGNVATAERAQGVIKVAGRREPVGMAGGFDAMNDGGTFTGQGTSVRVRITGPAIARGEAPARPATLTYERAGVAGPAIAGFWHCGP